MAEYTISIPKLKIRGWDWLLVVGLVLSPMTGLRIWKIGPAEVLVLVWCLKYVPRKKISSSDLALFFGLFLGSMALGTMWGLFFAREELVLSGWATWIYLAFASLGMYEGLRRNGWEYNERLLYSFATLAVLWNIALYALAITGLRSLLGAPLWYYHRYSAGGTNPHQIAIMMCGLTFIFAREIVQRRKLLWNLILMAGSSVILLATESSTAIMALALGMMVELILIVNNRMFGRGRHFRLIIVEVLVAGFILLIFYRLIYRFAYNWISSDSNGLGRIAIFSNIRNTFTKGPLFGLGPGMHSRGDGGRLIEYHNTYLEVLAASGLCGFFALVQFTVRLLKKTTSDNTFLPVIAALYTYGLAGFGMRRLIYWGILVFVFTIVTQKHQVRENQQP